MGNRSDSYITDLIAVSHPSSFDSMTLKYGVWNQVMAINNGAPDPSLINDKKRKVLLWYVKSDVVKGSGFSGLEVKSK